MAAPSGFTVAAATTASGCLPARRELATRWMFDDADADHAVHPALAWSIVALGLMESTWGTTPGKALTGLCVVTEAGRKITFGAGVLRRGCLLIGPLAWLDWLPIAFGERRRVLEHVTHSLVVEA